MPRGGLVRPNTNQYPTAFCDVGQSAGRLNAYCAAGRLSRLRLTELVTSITGLSAIGASTRNRSPPARGAHFLTSVSEDQLAGFDRGGSMVGGGTPV